MAMPGLGRELCREQKRTATGTCMKTPAKRSVPHTTALTCTQPEDTRQAGTHTLSSSCSFSLPGARVGNYSGNKCTLIFEMGFQLLAVPLLKSFRSPTYLDCSIRMSWTWWPFYFSCWSWSLTQLRTLSSQSGASLTRSMTAFSCLSCYEPKILLFYV